MYVDIQQNEATAAGLGNFRPVDGAAELAEFYPPPYQFLAPAGAGYGMGCAGTPGGCGCKGCHDKGLGDWSEAFTGDIGGLPAWLVWGGVAVGAVWLLNAGSRKSELSKARIDYERRVHEIRERHSVRGRARQARAKARSVVPSFGGARA